MVLGEFLLAKSKGISVPLLLTYGKMEQNDCITKSLVLESSAVFLYRFMMSPPPSRGKQALTAPDGLVFSSAQRPGYCSSIKYRLRREEGQPRPCPQTRSHSTWFLNPNFPLGFSGGYFLKKPRNLCLRLVYLDWFAIMGFWRRQTGLCQLGSPY